MKDGGGLGFYGKENQEFLSCRHVEFKLVIRYLSVLYHRQSEVQERVLNYKYKYGSHQNVDVIYNHKIG